ncbi:hypothetical protein ASG01_11950 [Chryseobacterium sp. Leaf180]|uniref:hypothetical protein n=1 Tax=Chryseobacterium sp. Leaf180 TaxID=1736289 RepID=UPI0006F7C48C|nr:hypothetical protein [Chryseobacterium sp. Leaf180]KQR92611.1 hypothetical protein ASG01_11950 [Chryseobacterium sp. Leaf180]
MHTHHPQTLVWGFFYCLKTILFDVPSLLVLRSIFQKNIQDFYLKKDVFNRSDVVGKVMIEVKDRVVGVIYRSFAVVDRNDEVPDVCFWVRDVNDEVLNVKFGVCNRNDGVHNV